MIDILGEPELFWNLINVQLGPDITLYLILLMSLYLVSEDKERPKTTQR